MSYFDNNITLYPNYKYDNNTHFIQNMNTYLLQKDALKTTTNKKRIGALCAEIQKICLKNKISIEYIEQLKCDIVYYMYIKDQERTH